MSKCGICLKRDVCDKCKKCLVGICDECRHITKYDTGGLYYAPVVSLCDFCMPKSEYEFIYQRLAAYRYCHKCERSLFYGRHKYDEECIERKLLPHYKARPIIEIRFIPEVAQIIFDYYYKPRRYYDGEI